MRKSIRIIVLVDNNVYLDNLEKRWGLSIYINLFNNRILFDTGSDPIALMKNASALNINLKSIDFVVISHDHGDHTGGLRLISKLLPGIKVYVPSHSRITDHLKNFNLTGVRVSDTVKLNDNIFVLGELRGGVGLWEIALVIKIMQKLLIFVGCSHPGIDKIVKKAIVDIGGKPYLVMGGFHGPSNEKLDYLIRNVEWKIAPLHCSGFNAIEYIRDKAPEKILIGGSGLEIVINPLELS